MGKVLKIEQYKFLKRLKDFAKMQADKSILRPDCLIMTYREWCSVNHPKRKGLLTNITE